MISSFSWFWYLPFQLKKLFRRHGYHGDSSSGSAGCRTAFLAFALRIADDEFRATPLCDVRRSPPTPGPLLRRYAAATAMRTFPVTSASQVRAVSEAIVFVFVAKCPGCQYDHPQDGFSVASLQRLLTRGHPVEGYCVICDHFWQISDEERANVAADLPGFASLVSRRLSQSWVS